MAEWVSQSEFARRVGVSQPRVSLLIKQGALKGAVRRDGRRCLVNVEKALPLWDRNRAPENRPEKRAKPPKKKGKRRKPTDEEKQDIISQAGVGDSSYNQARTLHTKYKAALAKLDLEVREGKLIPADEAKTLWTQHIAAAKAVLLGIKSACAEYVMEVMPDKSQAHHLLNIIDRNVKEALVELSGEKADGT